MRGRELGDECAFTFSRGRSRGAGLGAPLPISPPKRNDTWKNKRKLWSQKMYKYVRCINLVKPSSLRPFESPCFGVNVGQLKKINDTYSQPRPQGAFPWLSLGEVGCPTSKAREKRPGDEGDV